MNNAQLTFNNTPFTPSKIVCIGRNYVAHIHELGNEIPENMVVFNKPPSAISDTLHAQLDEPLHYEGELAFVVFNSTLAGVGFGLDLTKRDLQSRLKAKGLPWERAKAFDGAAIFSHFVSVPADITKLSLSLHIDGTLTQQGTVEHMLYKPDTILQELNSYTHLSDGDIIMTGTPAGVGVVPRDSDFVGEVFSGNDLLVSKSWRSH